MSCLHDACDLVLLREVLGELPLPLPWEIVAADMSQMAMRAPGGLQGVVGGQ